MSTLQRVQEDFSVPQTVSGICLGSIFIFGVASWPVINVKSTFPICIGPKVYIHSWGVNSRVEAWSAVKLALEQLQALNGIDSKLRCVLQWQHVSLQCLLQQPTVHTGAPSSSYCQCYCKAQCG